MLAARQIECQTPLVTIAQRGGDNWPVDAPASGDYNPSAQMNQTLSIAIETSCRAGGVALGVGDQLIDQTEFDSSRRHAGQIIGRLAELLSAADCQPDQIDEIYVAAGPGSFTGLRVGITVARTLGQFLERARCVAVPTHLAVADNARDLSWDRLGVVLDAGDGAVSTMTFSRSGEGIVADAEATTAPADQFLAAIPRPILLIGEGLWYHELVGDGVTLADEARWLPTAEGVWRASGGWGDAWPMKDSSSVLTSCCLSMSAPPRPSGPGKARSCCRQSQRKGYAMLSIETQFSVFLINKPGVLANVTAAMAKERINISALSMMDSVEHGVLRIVCNEPEKVRKLLGKTHDHWTESDVLLMDMDNRPGAFAAVAQTLAEAHVSIAYAYITGGGGKGRSKAVFKVADMKKAIKILKDIAAKPATKKKTTRKTPTGNKRRTK
jgi:tRNA threonylcarbamoyl adenosine modification protein YeaZ